MRSTVYLGLKLDAFLLHESDVHLLGCVSAGEVTSDVDVVVANDTCDYIGR